MGCSLTVGFTLSSPQIFCPKGAQREVRVGESRLDFLVGQTYVEMKGCTLVKGERALFPDAPTSRGTRHLRTLRELLSKGFQGLLEVLVLRPDAQCFAPNQETDPIFADQFWAAMGEGMEVKAHSFSFDDGRLIYMNGGWAESLASRGVI